MRVSFDGKKTSFILLLATLLLISGCIFDRSYRSADQKTIRDFSKGKKYRKHVGVMALTNTTIFKSTQVAKPFMDEILSGMESTAGDVILAVPGKTDVPASLLDPPRLPTGELEVFTLSSLAREAGLNTVVTPILMDIRVRKENTGFWLFKDVSHQLQIQTAAALYDTITGTRLALKILTDEVEIDEIQAGTLLSGQETHVGDLIEIAEKMGETLGKKMGKAVNNTLWLASVLKTEEGMCIINAGSDAGVKPGDRFSLLDASEFIDGLNGQRFIVPGPKTGEIIIRKVAPELSYGEPESGKLPLVGSIIIGE